MNEFKNEIGRIVRRKVAGLSADGTVGISADCLWSLAAGEISRLPSAPRGTNGAYLARQEFNEVVSRAPYTRFIYFPASV